MLQHESQEQAATPPAAQIRVTAEELAQAINALEARKEAAASHLAGTVPIGQVVEELKLDATPEEVWVQVQKQRQAATEKLASDKAASDKAAAEKFAAEKASADTPHESFHRAADEARKAAAQAVAAAQSAVQAASAQAASAQAGAQGYTHPRRRGRGKWWAIFAIGWAVYGIANGHLLPLHLTQTSPATVITGDGQRLTSGTLGKEVEVSGDSDTLVLKGDCPVLTVTGDGNHIRVEGSLERVVADGDGNTIVYTQGDAPALSGSGDGNTVTPNTP